jgi:hypothetical protein
MPTQGTGWAETDLNKTRSRRNFEDTSTWEAHAGPRFRLTQVTILRLKESGGGDGQEN